MSVQGLYEWVRTRLKENESEKFLKSITTGFSQQTAGKETFQDELEKAPQ